MPGSAITIITIIIITTTIIITTIIIIIAITTTTIITTIIIIIIIIIRGQRLMDETREMEITNNLRSKMRDEKRLSSSVGAVLAKVCSY